MQPILKTQACTRQVEVMANFHLLYVHLFIHKVTQPAGSRLNPPFLSSVGSYSYKTMQQCKQKSYRITALLSSLEYICPEILAYF